MKKYKSYSIFLLLVFLSNIVLTSCLGVKNSTVISTTTDKESGVKTGNVQYTFQVIKDPTVEEPVADLSLYQKDEYRFKTTVYEKQQLKTTKIFMTSIILYWTGCFLLGGFLFGEYTGDLNTAGALGGLGFGMLSSMTWALPLENKAKKPRYKYRPGEPIYEYKNGNYLSNTNISVFQNSHEKNYTSNESGLITLDLINDFNLNYSKVNQEERFDLIFNNTKFDKPYKVNSSLWLEHYGIIKNESVKISDLCTYGKIIGDVRKGLEYKIIDENTIYKKYKIEFLQNKYGWINYNDVDTYYSNSSQSNTSIAIKKYIEDYITNWQLQGEFESNENYLKRISTRDDKIIQIAQEAIDLFQEDYKNLISWNDATISRYDPNSQTFKIVVPNLKEAIVYIPINIAENFKKNWAVKTISNQKFTLVDGNWEISQFDINVPSVNYTAHYESNLVLDYDPTTQFPLDIPDITVPREEHMENLPQNDLLSIKYDIRTNLPRLASENKNGIAVVIGNMNYLHVDNVNYAINDAQLIKNYLINVFGFYPANVIFIRDATKADFEGWFGNKENYKGKLFNMLKENENEVFIYYSGHGAPGQHDSKGYFVPVDAEASFIEIQGYNTDVFYNNIAQLKTKNTTIVIDACFSGTGIIKNVSSIRPVANHPVFDIPNGILLTSSTADQPSTWLKEQKNGLFTYFFLKAIHDYKQTDINNDKSVTYSEIFESISNGSNGIPYFARRINSQEQTPQIKITDSDRALFKY